MKNQIQSVPVERLAANPGSPNRMSKSKFNKLVRNIERTGLYEPLIVRLLRSDRGLEARDTVDGAVVGCNDSHHDCDSVAASSRRDGDGISCESQKAGDAIQSDRGRLARDTDDGVAATERREVDGIDASARDARDTEAYEIINGHQRWLALKKLGFEKVDVIVWDIDDHQADIFLATLNRLGGSDVLEKKLALLKRLAKRMKASELAKLLSQSAGQIERLTNLARSDRGRACPEQSRREARDTNDADLQCVAFFLNDEQRKLIERAMSLAGGGEKTKAARNAAAVTRIAERFLNRVADFGELSRAATESPGDEVDG